MLNSIFYKDGHGRTRGLDYGQSFFRHSFGHAPRRSHPLADTAALLKGHAEDEATLRQILLE